MSGNTRLTQITRTPYFEKIAPGLTRLSKCQRSDLSHDVFAGLSVAAVALPVGVAYAQLAGFNPAVGLYSSILPLLAYAIFGTSRQLIIGPDAATCALVTAAVDPLAAVDQNLYESLSVTLALLAGVLCIGASFLRLGALADFLSKPILVGFLNGIALSIILGQIGKIFGYSMTKGGIVPRLIEFIEKLGLTHWPTLAVGLGSFLVLLITPRLFRGIPAALLAMIMAAIAVRMLGVKAAASLVDLRALGRIYQIDRREFALSIVATLGVVAVGSMEAILVAVVLAILRFVKLVSRPKIEILGEVKGFPGFHAVDRHPEAVTVPGLTLLRFNAPIVFFNAPFFKRGVIAAADAAGPSLKWLVLDMLPITLVDTTGLYTVDEIADTLRERGVVLAAAGRQTEWRLWAESRHRGLKDQKIAFYPTLREVIRDYQSVYAVSVNVHQVGSASN